MTDTTSPLLEAHERHHPLPWWRRRRPVTALELASSALEECRCAQLDQAQRAEYHTTMTHMLKERERRLTAEIQRLSTTQPEQQL